MQPLILYLRKNYTSTLPESTIKLIYGSCFHGNHVSFPSIHLGKILYGSVFKHSGTHALEKIENRGRSLTCTGLAATRRPATPPPTTRPSGLANETDIPPDLLLVPWLSVGMNDPDKESISKRPYKRKCFQKNCNSCYIEPSSCTCYIKLNAPVLD